MSLRQLKKYEEPIVDLIIKLGEKHRFEYAAFLETSDGPLIELRTEKLDNRAEPSKEFQKQVETDAKIVVHHNHLSGRSLSRSDWCGLIQLFNETFAHCEDGTTYYGRVLKTQQVENIICNYDNHLRVADDTLFKRIRDSQPNIEQKVYENLGIEVLNRAMRNREFVDYCYRWGTSNPGKDFDHEIEQAAHSIQSSL